MSESLFHHPILCSVASFFSSRQTGQHLMEIREVFYGNLIMRENLLATLNQPMLFCRLAWVSLRVLEAKLKLCIQRETFALVICFYVMNVCVSNLTL